MTLERPLMVTRNRGDPKGDPNDARKTVERMLEGDNYRENTLITKREKQEATRIIAEQRNKQREQKTLEPKRH